MENKTPDFGFNVQRILDCGFQIEEAIDPNPDNTLISYGMGFYFDIEKNWVQFNLRADFVKEEKQIFATGTVLTKFGIQNLQSFADENGDVNWPPNALETMFGIAFSHMRAMMCKNLAGTRFSNFIVPLVNPASMFKQLIERDPLYNAEKIKLPTNSETKSEKKNEELLEKAIKKQKQKIKKPKKQPN